MADDPKKPYGDVEYADPGYQEDGKKRYPLDSEVHCRAALSYISMPKNAAKYTGEQLAKVKGKIRAALKRYGVEVEASAAPDPPEQQISEPEAPAESGASSCPADAEPAAVLAVTQTTASPAEATTTKGAGHMDPAMIREALGLAPDASDDEVKAALVTAGLATAPPEPTADAGSADQRLAANATRAGLITIDPAQLAQYQDGMVRAQALAKRLEAQQRDTAIDAAVKAGKFPPARKQHYERAWDADPDGTRELIASLAPGLVPVTAMGYSTDAAEDALWDTEFARLFPAMKKEDSRG